MRGGGGTGGDTDDELHILRLQLPPLYRGHFKASSHTTQVPLQEACTLIQAVFTRVVDPDPANTYVLA